MPQDTSSIGRSPPTTAIVNGKIKAESIVPVPSIPTPTLHVEVRLSPESVISPQEIKKAAVEYINQAFSILHCESDLLGWSEVEILAQNVERIKVGECTSGQIRTVRTDPCKLQVHVYQPPSMDVVDEFSAADPNAEEGEDTTAATVAELPNKTLDGVWDSLIYEDDIKVRLLNYIYTTLLFSDANVDFNVVSWNRVCLLHGPPGTGKTSLCRALAQKLAIRLSDRYTHGKLVEINSHSLFSKWFSESGKLVQRLFSMVTEMVEDEGGFVVILIDEVESLTKARSASASGSEPSDAVRVVNALLTQLDKLKYRKNVLVMTTSNISESIDSAFIDRADIKQYIGLPPPRAIFWILASCMKELMRVGLVENTSMMDWDQVELLKAGVVIDETMDENAQRAGMKLMDLAQSCTGISGRTLRRLPVLAHARHIGLAASPISCQVWLDAMQQALLETKDELDKALQGSSV